MSVNKTFRIHDRIDERLHAVLMDSCRIGRQIVSVCPWRLPVFALALLDADADGDVRPADLLQVLRDDFAFSRCFADRRVISCSPTRATGASPRWPRCRQCRRRDPYQE